MKSKINEQFFYKLTSKKNIKFTKSVLTNIACSLFLLFILGISHYDVQPTSVLRYTSMLGSVIIFSLSMMVADLCNGNLKKKPIYSLPYLIITILTNAVLSKNTYYYATHIKNVSDYTKKSLVLPLIIIVLIFIFVTLMQFIHETIYYSDPDVDKKRKKKEEYDDAYTSFYDNKNVYVGSLDKGLEIHTNFDELIISSTKGVNVDGFHVYSPENDCTTAKYSVMIRKFDEKECSEEFLEEIEKIRKNIKNINKPEYKEYEIAINNAIYKCILDGFEIGKYKLVSVDVKKNNAVQILFEDKVLFPNKNDELFKKRIAFIATNKAPFIAAKPINTNEKVYKEEKDCFDAVVVID